MIDLRNERSLQKESTLTDLNGTPDCDNALPQKKAPLLKLDGTPDRDGRSCLKKASPAKMHGALLIDARVRGRGTQSLMATARVTIPPPRDA